MHNLTFRNLQLSDLEQLLSFINTLSSEETYIRLQGKQVTLEEEEKYLKEFLKNVEKKKAIKILAFDRDELVGAADISLGFGAEKHVGIFGITVKKEYRGQGIGKQLTKQILEEAKTKLDKLEIISLSVFAENEIAIKLYKSFGFQEYGRLPRGVIRKGKYSDHVYMYLDVTQKQTSKTEKLINQANSEIKSGKISKKFTNANDFLANLNK